jgi:hypothetical protein
VVVSDKLVVLDNIPFELEASKILKHMRAHGDLRRYEDKINELIEVVTPLARPKAMYKIACVGNNADDFLEIDKVKFNSLLLKDKLNKMENVFVCVGTCGAEVEELDIPANDVMKRFCLDAVKNMIMFSASGYLRNHLIQRYHLDKVSVLNPGETESFPISNLRNLFTILGDVEKSIGVKLTENCAMVPTKSGCGIYYSSETEFVSCRLCPQIRCHGRRAPYEPELARNYPARNEF